jgi:hypothetical protein
VDFDAVGERRGFVGGPAREAAVAARAVSRSVADLVLPSVAGRTGDVSWLLDAEENGESLPKMDHLLLPGVTGVVGVLGDFRVRDSLDAEAILSREREEWRLAMLGIDAMEGGTIPSKPKNRPDAGFWLSLRMMKRRRPGAGVHGAEEGGIVWRCSACTRRKR